MSLRRQVQLGYLNEAIADQIAALGAKIPIAAELDEVLADDAKQEGMRIGAVVKVIVLVPAG
jgi:hypothetical protein